jgi:AcrR family transcriptional regulator
MSAQSGGSESGRRWESGRPVDDLTARARIRDAALAQFAERGVAGTSLRRIAEAVGVSVGLVQHHFGSKEGLRQACDDYVLEYVRQQAREAITEGAVADPGFLTAAYESASPVVRYLSRALVEEFPAADSLFDQMVAVAEEYLASIDPDTSAADLHTRAAVLTAMKLGVTVLHAQLFRVLGTGSDTAWREISSAMLDIMSPAVIGTDLLRLARAGLDRRRAAHGETGNSSETTQRREQ